MLYNGGKTGQEAKLEWYENADDFKASSPNKKQLYVKEFHSFGKTKLSIALLNQARIMKKMN